MSDFLYNVTMVVGTFGAVFGLGYASMWAFEKIADRSDK